MLYWLMKNVLIGPFVRTLFKPWVEGEENVPEHGGAIFASNHLSFSDSVFLPLVVDRRMTFPAKMEYFTGTGVKGWLTKNFFKGMGQIPIDRSGGEASMAALNSGLKVLKRGELFGIYPEGTRSPDGKLYKGKTGVARMALEAKVPVIPVAMIDTDKAQPTGQVIPNVKRGQVGIRFGKPLDFSRYEGMEDDRTVLRSITDEIMYELMQLSGQEYVDVYAASVKDRIAARAKAAVEGARVAVDKAVDQTKVTAEQVRSQVEGRVETARTQIEGGVQSARTQIEGQIETAKTQFEQVGEQLRSRQAKSDEPTGEDDNPAAGDESPAEESSADESPADERSADESPVNESPAEESPADQSAAVESVPAQAGSGIPQDGDEQHR
ncbi:1-acyl-sn-glycerol-3-phosphate acyltransferase [Ornithinimicrobium ciconiae]|uniref:1-acyl-sn-glycerol-3-phosphate acyltransferase n=1 Tax=Ornithinimicrobium ciconiae TaxID=2594265 RepID=A0A516GFK0_9MICO|nr:1-acyl-sn-glycerol-3-phosphate acyltransferase [Ornithinimicrobium ciconiae]